MAQTKISKRTLKQAKRVASVDRAPLSPSISPDDFPDESTIRAENMAALLKAYGETGSIDVALNVVDLTKSTFRNYLTSGRFKEQFYKVSGCLRSLAVSEVMHIMLNSENEGMKLKAADIILRTTDEGSLSAPSHNTYNVNIIQAIDSLKASPVGSEIFEHIRAAQSSLLIEAEVIEDECESGESTPQDITLE